MTEAGLKTLIETTLAIPVFEGKDSIRYPAATLEVTKISPALFGDGRTARREASAEINLWFTDKAGRDNAVQAMIFVMDAQTDITSPEIETYYDTTAKKYRAVINTLFLYEGTGKYLFENGHLYQDSLKKQYNFTYDAPEGELLCESLGGSDQFSIQDGELYVNQN